MTRHNIFLLFAVLLWNVSYSQDTAITSNRKISIGLGGSLNFYHYGFKPIIGFEHKYETSSNYDYGLRFQYNLKKKISIKSGLMYSMTGYNLQYKFIFINPGDPFIPRESKLKLRYLDIPLIADLSLLNIKKIKLFSSLGIMAAFLVYSKETSIYEDNSERDSKFLNQNLNSILYSTQISIGMEYSLGYKLFIIMEPYINYGFNKLDINIMSSNPISYGGLLSVNYKF